jgi:hypothetical protein
MRRNICLFTLALTMTFALLLPLTARLQSLGATEANTALQGRTLSYYQRPGVELGLTPLPIDSAATAQSRAGVRLVFDTSFIDPNSVNQGNGFYTPSGIGGLSGACERVTAHERVTYKWTMPRTIDNQGGSVELSVKVMPKPEGPGANLAATIGVGGEVNEKNNKSSEVNAYAVGRETKEATGTFILIPRDYSEGRYYLELMVRLHGGMDIKFRYLIELASRGGGGDLEYDTDRPGQDYRNFDLPAARPQLCQAECGADPKCKAFTYVKPGVQGSSARCWLKSGVPAAGRSSCCVSGVKRPIS